MEVALYESHHLFPFGNPDQKSNPNAMYNREEWTDWTVSEDPEKDPPMPALEHWMIPILDGLAALEFPGAMALVSFNVDPQQNLVIADTSRKWIQIITAPETKDEQGIPQIIKEDNTTTCEILWASPRESRIDDPWDMITPEQRKNRDLTSNPLFWREFFQQALLQTQEEAKQNAQQVKQEAEAAIKDAKHNADKYNILEAMVRQPTAFI